MTSITVTKRGADRIRNGHLWIYRSDVVSAEEASGSAVVGVRDQNRNFIGQAFYSDSSQIALRFLSTTEERIDKEWWRERIRAAAARRSSISTDTNAFRLIYSEGDLLPSIILDKYAEVLVLQTLSQGSEAIKSLLVEILSEEFSPQATVERNDVRVRQFEGLELTKGTLKGNCPDEFEITQSGIRFMVAPLSGQKTGSFLDQRENRVAAQTLAHGRALDCFTFNGAFALHLASSCDSVIGIDISADAVAAAQKNAELNNLNNVEFREANVFDALREFEAAGEKFDTIVLDPPAFAKSRATIKPAARGYKEINLRALKLLNPGGVLVTCTCSYHMSEQNFIQLIAEAAVDARRRLQIVEKRMQSSDHPVLLTVPETYYLKCVIARVVE